MKICTICGIEKPEEEFYQNGKYRRNQCQNCMSQTATKRTSKWRQQAKQMLIDKFGGKCFICGYNKSKRALHFHHIDPTEKEFEIGGYGKSRARLLKEIEKCVLVCSNCHAEIEDGMHKIIRPKPAILTRADGEVETLLSAK